MVSLLADGPFTAAYQGRPINLADWAIIGGYMPQERVLFAAKTAPFASAQEMMDYAKTNPITDLGRRLVLVRPRDRGVCQEARAADRGGGAALGPGRLDRGAGRARDDGGDGHRHAGVVGGQRR